MTGTYTMQNAKPGTLGHFLREAFGSGDILDLPQWFREVAETMRLPTLSALPVQPVAWMHDGENRLDICHATIRQLLIDAKCGKQVEHYTIPLYAPQPPAIDAEALYAAILEIPLPDPKHRSDARDGVSSFATWGMDQVQEVQKAAADLVRAALQPKEAK